MLRGYAPVPVQAGWDIEVLVAQPRLEADAGAAVTVVDEHAVAQKATPPTRYAQTLDGPCSARRALRASMMAARSMLAAGGFVVDRRRRMQPVRPGDHSGGRAGDGHRNRVGLAADTCGTEDRELLGELRRVAARALGGIAAARLRLEFVAAVPAYELEDGQGPVHSKRSAPMIGSTTAATAP